MGSLNYVLWVILTMGTLWTPAELRANPRLFNHSDEQAAYENCQEEIQSCAAGRRGGKTRINARKIIDAACSNTEWPDWRGFLAAPTWQQVKDLYWKLLNRMIPDKLIAYKSESELYIRLKTNAEIHLEGLDKMSRIEGQPWNYMCIDETDDTKFDEIEEHIFPMMSDRQAKLIFTGVPEGQKYLYRLSVKYPDSFFTWKSADVFPLYMGKKRAAEEIRKAKERMTKRLYLQEYEASFETLANRIYYEFEKKSHVRTGLLRQIYNPKFNLILAFDFNVSPGTAGIGMEIDGDMNIIGEVHIPDNSTTKSICRKIIADWGNHQGRVISYGDPTGGNRGSSQTEGNDWQIIEDMLSAENAFGRKFELRVKSKHPAQRDLINAMNSRFRTADDMIHCYIDSSCIYTIGDFYGVTVLKGSAGEIDKSDLTMTHHSDSWMHWADYEYPMDGGHVVKVKDW